MTLLLIPMAYLTGIGALWLLHVLTDERPAPYPFRWESIWRTPPPAAALIGAPFVALVWWLI